MRMKFYAACLFSAFLIVVGCNSEEPSPSAESEVAEVVEDASVDELIDTLISDGDSTEAESPDPPALTPDGEDEIPQHFLDAPVRKIVQKHANGKPHKAFQAKLLGPRSVIQHGRYEEYFSTGQKLKAGNYEYGRKTGEWSFWDQSGTLRKQGIYKKDRQQGDWKKFRADASMEWIEKYLDGQPHGIWEAFREDGRTIAWRRGYQNGKRHGEWEDFYPDGKPQGLETYREGKLHGEAKSWNKAGKLVGEGAYQDGKRHGLFRLFDEEGNKLVEESAWEAGVRKGKT